MNRFKQSQWIIGGLGFTLVLMGWVSFAAYEKTRELTDNADNIYSTYELINTITSFNGNMVTAESGRRGYINTGSLSELNRYQRAIDQLERELDKIRSYLHERDTLTRKEIEQLSSLVQQRVALLQYSIAIYKPNTSDDLEQAAILGKSVIIRDRIVDILSAIETNEKQSLESKIDHSYDNIREVTLLVITGTLASFSILLGVYFILNHQTKQQQKTEKAKQKLLQEKELLALKLQLFSMISHEFRTPLSVIFSSSQLLEEGLRGEVDNKSYKNIYRIQSSVKLMNQFLTDILLFTRAEAGNIKFNPESLDIESFCLNLLEDMQYINASHIPIKFISTTSLPRITADDKLLYSILSNLLLNAIKYSPDGGEITLSLSNDYTNTILQIQDEGLGISSEDLERIYEPFYRGKNVSNIIGTGLGLPVVKKCVELHGGEIRVSSAIDKGTIFMVKIPLIHS